MLKILGSVVATVLVCVLGFLSPKLVEDNDGHIFVPLLVIGLFGPIFTMVSKNLYYKEFFWATPDRKTMTVTAVMGTAVTFHFFNQIAHGDWIFNAQSKLFGTVYFGIKLVLVLFFLYLGPMLNRKRVT